MKTHLALLCTAVLALLSAHAHAASLLLKDTALTGTLIESKEVPDGTTAKIPLSKKYLLEYFGFPNVKPANAVFCVNNDDEKTVLINLCSKDGVVTYGTLLKYDSTAITSFGSLKSQRAYFYVPAKALGSAVTGNSVITARTFVLHGLTGTKYTFTFTGTGALPGSGATNGLLQLGFTGILNGQ